MKKLLSKLITVPLICLNLVSCTKYLYKIGEVLQEKKVNPSLIKINNTQIQAGEKAYILRVKTEDGIYTLDVSDGYQKTIEALEEVIIPGSKIKFLDSTEDFGEITEIFTSDRIGKISGDNIEVLE